MREAFVSGGSGDLFFRSFYRWSGTMQKRDDDMMQWKDNWSPYSVRDMIGAAVVIVIYCIIMGLIYSLSGS